MAKWSRLISEQKNSGLTIRDFCRQHDLSWHAYYYWLKKIREQIVSELSSGSAEHKQQWHKKSYPLMRITSHKG